jgi:drug/metabolite transporter (DMT)-like permease
MALASVEVDRSRTAAFYLLVSVVGISVLPLVMVVVGAPDSPFLFGASLSLGTSVGALVFLRARYGSYLRNPAIVSLIRKNLISLPILFVLLGTFEFTFFAWATRFIDATVATILWGSWPIIFVFLLQRVFSSRPDQSSRYRRITVSLVVLMVFSLIGLAYVVLSQTSHQDSLEPTSDQSYLGFLLALASGILITLNIFSFSWSRDMARKSRSLWGSEPSQSMELFFITVVVCVSNLFTAPIKVLFSMAATEQIQPDVILVGVIFGGTLRVGSSLLWRHANLITSALGINALGYAEPLFGVLWLALFWEVDIPRLDYLIIGTCAIIASNILINAQVEISRGFKSAILAMWATGAIVYFRDDGPLWGSGRFFGVLALLAGVLILLLGVRFTNASTATAGRHTLTQGPSPMKKPTVAKATVAVNGFDMARMFTLALYAAVAVFLAVAVRPALEGWMGWLVELFAVSFSTAVIASAFGALGPRLKRARTPGPAAGGRISTSMDGNWEHRERRIAHWTFALVAVGTYLSFLYLLWDKWLN